MSSFVWDVQEGRSDKVHFPERIESIKLVTCVKPKELIFKRSNVTAVFFADFLKFLREVLETVARPTGCAPKTCGVSDRSF